MSARAKGGSRLIYGLAQLSGRERVLLGLLGGVALPLAVVFLALLPLIEARNAARAEAAEGEAVLAWVADQVRALPAEGGQPVQAASTAAPIGISAIEQSLVQAGLRGGVADLSNRDTGGVDLSFDAVPFEALAAWLSQATPGWGYRIAAFRIERGPEPGLVRASFELEAGS